jgi:hypothetical protein
MDESLATLTEALREIFAAGTTIDRKKYVAALIAVAEFLDRVDSDAGNAATGLADLAVALADLDEGIVHPILQKAPRWDGHPDRTDIWMARADAAVGIEFLMRTGMTQEDIWKREVMKRQGLNRLVRAGRDGATLENSIFGWRKTLKRASMKARARDYGEDVGAIAGNKPAIQAFRDGLALVDFTADRYGLDRCHHTGIAMLDRANRRALGLTID